MKDFRNVLLRTTLHTRNTLSSSIFPALFSDNVNQFFSNCNFFVDPSQCKARHGKARHGQARQGKARQRKARQGKARQGKATQGRTRQGMPRQAKHKSIPQEASERKAKPVECTRTIIQQANGKPMETKPNKTKHSAAKHAWMPGREEGRGGAR